MIGMPWSRTLQVVGSVDTFLEVNLGPPVIIKDLINVLNQSIPHQFSGYPVEGCEFPVFLNRLKFESNCLDIWDIPEGFASYNIIFIVQAGRPGTHGA